jgi:hypothetical protein
VSGGSAPLNLSLVATSRFAWGALPYDEPSGEGVNPAPIYGYGSYFLCWNAVLGTEDQDAFDAWQALVHA